MMGITPVMATLTGSGLAAAILRPTTFLAYCTGCGARPRS